MIECVRVCQYKQIELLVPKCSTDDYQPYTTLQLSVCRRAHTSKCLINYYTLKGNGDQHCVHVHCLPVHLTSPFLPVRYPINAKFQIIFF